jgi:hypothetical protein
MEIVQNLWQVGGGDFTAPEDAAIYLVRSKSISFIRPRRLYPQLKIYAGA